MRIKRIWHAVLAGVLAFWGLMLLDVLTFSGADDVLGIGAIAAAVLILFDR